MGFKCIIFYFSQSGGTKLIADIISKEFRSKNNDCELYQFEKMRKDVEFLEAYDFSDIDLIGFGTPIYYFNPPYHILKILSRFPKFDNMKGFLFCTSGGNPGSTLNQLKMLLNQKGIKIIDGNDRIVCQDRHQFYRDFGYFFPPSKGHPDDKDFQTAKKFADNVQDKVESKFEGEKDDFWNRDSLFAKLCSYNGLNRWFPKFNLNETKCNLCGICAKVCPIDNIILKPYPIWKGNCSRCYICEMSCPVTAIECDWDWMIEMMNRIMRKRGFFPDSVRKYSFRSRFVLIVKQMRAYLILFSIWVKYKF